MRKSNADHFTIRILQTSWGMMRVPMGGKSTTAALGPPASVERITTTTLPNGFRGPKGRH